MSKSKKSPKLRANNKQVAAIILITVVALAALGALLFSTDLLAGKASFIRPGSLKGIQEAFFSDVLEPGELLVRLEVPEDIEGGVPFLVNVYVSFSKTNVAGLINIKLASSGVKFTGKIQDPFPASLGIPWTKNAYKLISKDPGTLIVDQGKDGFSKVNRGRYYLLGSLEAVAHKPASDFEIQLESSYWTQAHYIDPEDWDVIKSPIPTYKEKLCWGDSAGAGPKAYYGNSFGELVTAGFLYDRDVLVSEYKPPKIEETLKSYVLKQAPTRIKRNALCVPKKYPCEYRDCGWIDDGCGKAVDCGKGNKQFAVKKKMGAVCVDNVLTLK